MTHFPEIDLQVERTQISIDILEKQREIGDIQNRLRNEAAPIHQSMLESAKSALNNLLGRLAEIPKASTQFTEQFNSIESTILEYNSIPRGFSGTSSAARREADLNVSKESALRASVFSKFANLKDDIEAAKTANIEQTPVIPNNDGIVTPALTNTSQSPLIPLVIVGGIILIIATSSKRIKRH